MGIEQTLRLRQDSLISYREKKDDNGMETGERLRSKRSLASPDCLGSTSQVGLLMLLCYRCLRSVECHCFWGMHGCR